SSLKGACDKETPLAHSYTTSALTHYFKMRTPNSLGSMCRPTPQVGGFQNLFGGLKNTPPRVPGTPLSQKILGTNLLGPPEVPPPPFSPAPLSPPNRPMVSPLATPSKGAASGWGRPVVAEGLFRKWQSPFKPPLSLGGSFPTSPPKRFWAHASFSPILNPALETQVPSPESPHSLMNYLASPIGHSFCCNPQNESSLSMWSC
ncbi:hypothetical protein L0F63_007035, partial [Massospora cicadina]